MQRSVQTFKDFDASIHTKVDFVSRQAETRTSANKPSFYAGVDVQLSTDNSQPVIHRPFLTPTTMKHQLKAIEIQGITNQSTKTTIETAIESRKREGNGRDHIKDPDVRAMVQDLHHYSVRRGNEMIQQHDQLAELAEQVKIDDVNGMTDEEMERIIIRLVENEDGKGPAPYTGEDRKPTKGKEKEFEQYRHHQFVKRWGLFSESEGADEEWFIPSPTVLPEDDPEYLCDMCRHIDFDLLFSKRGLPGNLTAGPTSIGLWALGKVMRSERCSFCTLLRRKIQEDGLSNGVWGTSKVIDGQGRHSIQIPKCIEPGQYLLRAEMIALHGAGSYPGAQFYMECAQINVVGGSGSKAPSTVSLPGAYKVCEMKAVFDASQANVFRNRDPTRAFPSTSTGRPWRATTPPARMSLPVKDFIKAG